MIRSRVSHVKQTKSFQMDITIVERNCEKDRIMQKTL